MRGKPIPVPADERVYETSLTYMLRLSGPMVVSTISFTIMQFVDRYMVSRLGTNALAAILPAAYVSFLPGGFALGATASLNTFVSQSLGRGDQAACANYFWQMLYMGFAYSLAVALVMWPAAPFVFAAMGQPPAVSHMEVIYLRIMLLAHFAAMVNWSSNQFFMGIHKPVVTMISSLCGQVVNVVANYGLIFGKFGLPALGIAGAGWGTLTGITVAATINLLVFLSGPMDRRFQSRRNLYVDVVKMRHLIGVGLPAGIGLMLNVALWGVALFWLVGRFGKEALAATSAVLSYPNVSAMPVVGVATALTAAVGKSIGAGRKELAFRQTHITLRLGLVYMGLVGACFFFLRDSLMVFWSRDPHVIAIGSRILVCAALYQVFHASRIIYSGALRGAGDTIWIAVASGIGSVVILGAGGALVAWTLPELGALGPWAVATLSIVGVGLAHRWRFHKGRWMRIDLFRGRPGPGPFAVESSGD
jgi:MATE family multidrug resistance protein